jgi:hypothetical protein
MTETLLFQLPEAHVSWSFWVVSSPQDRDRKVAPSIH